MVLFGEPVYVAPMASAGYLLGLLHGATAQLNQAQGDSAEAANTQNSLLFFHVKNVLNIAHVPRFKR